MCLHRIECPTCSSPQYVLLEVRGPTETVCPVCDRKLQIVKTYGGLDLDVFDIDNVSEDQTETELET